MLTLIIIGSIILWLGLGLLGLYIASYDRDIKVWELFFTLLGAALLTAEILTSERFSDNILFKKRGKK